MGDNSEYEAVEQQIAECTGDFIEIQNKKIIEVPPLPEHITHIRLNGSNDMILKFPEVYSPQLQIITIHGTGIQELPEDLPDTIEGIYLSKTECKLPTKLPKNLKQLCISCSNLEIIPEFPETLLSFQCINNSRIQHLPKLPDNLSNLSLMCTKYITELPEVLPSRLSYLNIQCSGIKSLPKILPNSLSTLYINNTPIKDLPENIPDSLLFVSIKNQCIPNIDCWSNLKENLRTIITHRKCMADVRMDVTGYYSRKRSVSRCKVIKEELMAVTWHTDRVLDWCDPKAFDYED